MKTYIFHVNGMHCASCTLLIEETFKEFPNISQVKASLANNQVTITGDFTGLPEALAEDLTKSVKSYGYTISLEQFRKDARWEDFAYAFPIALLFIAGFLALQKAGLVNFITTSDVSYGTAFIIGLIASVSTCLAVVGGLVLSLSASSAKEGGTWRTQTLFHAGRLGGFFVLGGAIGTIGSAFQLGLNANIVLGIMVALAMLILGINLLDIFHFAKRLQFTLPARLSKHIVRGSKHDHYLAPVLVGIGTFFLPCGFTQSIQLYTLATGSFIKGALTMAVFALGTLPMLALLSFGALNIAHKSWKGIFFKTAGIIVIALALFNLANTLAAAGIINPLFNL
ncbi:MAG: sulfite exporter TauE/SafE family protein [Candidatus Harrisonbacteria bacterium]|nr:sulfite exporter TauE/SafE family protein [Candidatus Harrisonbacteria bacterium]